MLVSELGWCVPWGKHVDVFCILIPSLSLVMEVIGLEWVSSCSTGRVANDCRGHFITNSLFRIIFVEPLRSTLCLLNAGVLEPWAVEVSGARHNLLRDIHLFPSSVLSDDLWSACEWSASSSCWIYLLCSFQNKLPICQFWQFTFPGVNIQGFSGTLSHHSVKTLVCAFSLAPCGSKATIHRITLVIVQNPRCSG